MEKNFGCANWRSYIPSPVCEQHPEFEDFYLIAWQMAFDHIRHIDGMPQTPYMDEAFCDTQLWIWDSCFMALFCKYAGQVFPGVETLDNFYELLYGGKKLAKIIPTEHDPEWTSATAGQPHDIKLHIADNPPLFAWAEYENALISGDKERIRDLLCDKQFLQKHYFWLESLRESVTLPGVFAPTCLIHVEHGYKWEGGRSGMDNTPRGRTGKHALSDRPNNPDMLWIDAICQQALSAQKISALFSILGDKESAADWYEKYTEKKNTVNALYWDDANSFYFDIHCDTHDFIPVMSIASYWALTAGIACESRANGMLRHLLDPLEFGGTVPFPSLAGNDADYNADGKYWRGGVWLPTAYATLKGLANYRFFREAHSTAYKLLTHMYNTYTQYTPHTIWESYSPEQCRPATSVHGDKNVRPDFCGWSALGPISVFIEFVLGFHTVNAFERTVEWEKPDDIQGEIGIKNLRFGDVCTDIVAKDTLCTVTANASYTLKINGRSFDIKPGKTTLAL